jgi:LysR family transcriptional regulator, nitrogen assimilation regulatory protein
MAIDWQLDLRPLRYFVSVAEEKSLTKAAERLNVAQPALSRQMQKLEAALATPLFIRSARGVELTEAGEILLRRAYLIFNQIQQTVHDVTAGANHPQGIVTVGMPPTPGEFIAPVLLERIKRNFPDIELRFLEGFSGILEQRLANNEIGIAVMHDPKPGSDIVVSELLVEHLWVIGAAGSLDRPSYTLAEAAALPLILPSRPNYLRMLIDSHAEREKLTLNIVQRSDGVWHTKALVRYGHGQTILTYGAVLSEMQHGTLDAVPITDPRIDWTLCVAMRRDQSRKPAFIVVGEAIGEIVGDLVARQIWK